MRKKKTRDGRGGIVGTAGAFLVKRDILFELAPTCGLAAPHPLADVVCRECDKFPPFEEGLQLLNPPENGEMREGITFFFLKK